MSVQLLILAAVLSVVARFDNGLSGQRKAHGSKREKGILSSTMPVEWSPVNTPDLDTGLDIGFHSFPALSLASAFSMSV